MICCAVCPQHWKRLRRTYGPQFCPVMHSSVISTSVQVSVVAALSHSACFAPHCVHSRLCPVCFLQSGGCRHVGDLLHPRVSSGNELLFICVRVLTLLVYSWHAGTRVTRHTVKVWPWGVMCLWSHKDTGIVALEAFSWDNTWKTSGA